jgi:protein tyrosine phosphatase (PTP) superfamily phosphohydrolase (DUF442 family)
MTFRIYIAQSAAFALLVSFAPSVGAAPFQAEQAKPPATAHAMGIRMKAKGVPNFGQVTPNLYRGGQPGPDGLQVLKDEEATATKLGMQYVSIPSHCPFPKDEVFAKFLRVLRENTGKKAFVHCRLGDDRTGMAVAAYRIAEEGWSAEEAMKEMKAFGFSTMHHAMCPGLADYEESFPQRLKTSRAFKELQPYGSNTTMK